MHCVYISIYIIYNIYKNIYLKVATPAVNIAAAERPLVSCGTVRGRRCEIIVGGSQFAWRVTWWGTHLKELAPNDTLKY